MIQNTNDTGDEEEMFHCSDINSQSDLSSYSVTNGILCKWPLIYLWYKFQAFWINVGGLAVFVGLVYLGYTLLLYQKHLHRLPHLYRKLATFVIDLHSFLEFRTRSHVELLLCLWNCFVHGTSFPWNGWTLKLSMFPATFCLCTELHVLMGLTFHSSSDVLL